MTIQIVVPTKNCINNCNFCISRMHGNPYEDCFDEFQMKKRLKFAVNNGVNTCIITGTGEPFQNRSFLEKLGYLFKKMDHPFPNVEFQTSGVMLTDELMDEVVGKESPFYYKNIVILNYLGVNTISLSTSDIFDSNNNLEIMGVPEKLKFDLKEICSFIKQQGFNLRLSLNMTYVYDSKTPRDILSQAKNLGADQITFRKLYYSDDNSSQTKWVKENACKKYILGKINEYIVGYNGVPGEGKPLYHLPFGPMVYSIEGMSTVIDEDCMSKEDNEKLKYMILRENGKLYCQWDDEGSLIF